MKKALLAAIVAGGLVVGALASSAPAQGSLLEATVRPFEPTSVDVLEFPVESPGGEPRGTAGWRVVQGTGNCCENFIGTTREGRLMDFGDTHLVYSDDLGETWHEVVPVGTILNGEGAVADAPGGDVVGVSWVTYDGDKLLAYKYEAATKRWLWQENHLHTPFFDRPWIATVKGPFRFGPVTVPYISILTSNFTNDVHYISLDGLNYFIPSTRAGDQTTGSTVSKWLDLPKDPDADWTQPITELGVGPLAGGGALTQGGQFVDVPWMLMESPEIKWSGYTFPDDALPDGRLLSDSKGRLHHVATFPGESAFTYMMSPSGGRGWGGELVQLPGNLVVEDWDFKANAGLGKAVVGIHAHDPKRNVDQDLVFELSIDEDVIVERVYFVGAGDAPATSGVTGGEYRFDFSTIGIMPTGEIVTTFVDKAHIDPSLAILVDTSEVVRGDALPVISDLSARPTPFTPDGDGRRDRVRISFRLSEPARVSVVVRRGARTVATLLDGEPVRGRRSVSWDGERAGGRPAPAGRYSFDVTAVDEAGNERVATGVIRLRRARG
ncbi:MAG TPA: FlgD immunoglobulin-like domain containing protein [Actinomycetota bacterium]|nr:FlgD immunoglobulin-like domain containing protein [Actinomycetota bacterium]